MWENMWSFHALSVPLFLNLHFSTNQETFGFLTSLLECLWRLSPIEQETQVQSQGLEDSLEKDRNSLQSSCLGNSMDRGAWWAIVHGVAKSQTLLLSD